VVLNYEKALADAPSDYRRWLFVMTSPFVFRDRARLSHGLRPLMG
jgi:hypothetical protein